MEKKLFEFKTKTIVATGLGAALFMILFMYVKVPTWVQGTDVKTAYGLLGFFAALFGPICGALIGFIGHGLSDFVLYGSPWWSWVIASGVTGLFMGFAYKKLQVENGVFKTKDVITFNVWQVIGNVVAWIVVAPILDIVIYAEPANKVFVQGAVAAVSNIVSAAIIGTLLLFAYSKTRAGEGSLSKEK